MSYNGLSQISGVHPQVGAISLYQSGYIGNSPVLLVTGLPEQVYRSSVKSAHHLIIKALLSFGIMFISTSSSTNSFLLFFLFFFHPHAALRLSFTISNLQLTPTSSTSSYSLLPSLSFSCSLSLSHFISLFFCAFASSSASFHTMFR